MSTHPIGAPGSIARYLSDAARDGRVFPAPFVVLGYWTSSNKVDEIAVGRTRQMAEERFARGNKKGVPPREWRLVDVREHGCKVAEPLPGVPRCGDTVFHRPTGHELGVAWADEKSGRFSWFGWPDGQGELADCDLVAKCSDQEHREQVDKWLDYLRPGKQTEGSGERARRVRELYRPQWGGYLCWWYFTPENAQKRANGCAHAHAIVYADDAEQARTQAKAELGIVASAARHVRPVREAPYVSEFEGFVAMLRGAATPHEVHPDQVDKEVAVVHVFDEAQNACSFVFVRKHLVRFDW